MTPAKEAAYKAGLTEALQKGYDTLAKGGTALDAVETAVRLLEDNPLFNAGKGAVFTNEGRNEMDAAIMNGQTLAAGSIAGVTTIKNPISTARAVMEKSKHVMMVGPGAEKFAASVGQQIVDPSYFYTNERWDGLQKAKEQEAMDSSIEKIKRPADKIKGEMKRLKEPMKKNEQPAALKQPENKDYKYGTVGAVALDRYGNLAAATSTGGMTNKRFGRVGDAPIIGAGTYANNATCAISCTGWGEFFIRLVVAKTISDLVEYKNYSIQKAADEVCMKQVPALGGDGGLIALDKKGNIAMPFNTAGMYRGYIKEGKIVVKIYKDE
jgi:beta-aspartyl-peptidase (threonine type)